MECKTVGVKSSKIAGKIFPVAKFRLGSVGRFGGKAYICDAEFVMGAA